MPEEGSWWTYGQILDEAAQFAREEQSTPVSACPDDGEPLRSGPHGERYCPFCSWRDRG